MMTISMSGPSNVPGLRIYTLLIVAAVVGSGQDAFGHEKVLGTGISISSLGHILTTKDIVKGCSKITVQRFGFFEDEVTTHQASLISESSEFDLAILKADLPKGRPFAHILVSAEGYVALPDKDVKYTLSGFMEHMNQLD